MAPMSARVSGTVVEVLVDDNRDVKAGDILVRLDPTDYEVALAQARAAAEAAKADLDNSLVNVPLTDETTQSLVQQAEAALAAPRTPARSPRTTWRSGRGSSRPTGRRRRRPGRPSGWPRRIWIGPRLDRERTKELVDAKMIAQQDFDHADAAFQSAQAALDAPGRR